MTSASRKLLKFFTALHVNTNDRESTPSIDFEAANKLQQVSKFTNTEPTINEYWLSIFPNSFLVLVFSRACNIPLPIVNIFNFQILNPTVHFFLTNSELLSELSEFICNSDSKEPRIGHQIWPNQLLSQWARLCSCSL